MTTVTHPQLFGVPSTGKSSNRKRPRGQLLKWVGNKFRYADIIARHLPSEMGTYYEPFVGTGAVLATLAPEHAIAGDTLPTLVELLQIVQTEPELLVRHYDTARKEILRGGRTAYERIKDRYNRHPSPEDLLVLSRTCYGGVMRFTRLGTISTPMGPHNPMPADKLASYMSDWQARLEGTTFVKLGFETTMSMAAQGDTVYCDPPYIHSQTILYGAQSFRLAQLWEAVGSAVNRGVRVAVSLDGWRKSGKKTIDLNVPAGLFSREVLIERGGCMLRRFQMNGSDMAYEQVADRLLLSW
ncbi:MAG TPA: Dam family site-specific DNA-(adenine-N6)-methyltransferase [Solirubrobacteraceae bacterium]|nr:Dam family site-specific DNA-(adenine-N6)-methyltransferase [Solirubrobacteraceae bacterium]